MKTLQIAHFVHVKDDHRHIEQTSGAVDGDL